MSAKTGVAPQCQTAFARRDERQRGHDHLVPGADARRVEGEMERGRAARRRHRLGGADAAREGLLELLDSRPLGQPA